MLVESAAATHTGLVRAVNEDSYLVLPDLVLVADGMGGHAAGDVASALAVAAFESLGGIERLEVDDVIDAVHRANRAILDEAAAHPDKAGMGTTLTGLAVVDEAGTPHWLIFNVGDSRAYQLVDGVAHQLTADHSEVAELIADGRLSAQDARYHPLRHVITRSVGAEPALVADTWLAPVKAGDTFLLCTDGLTNELDDEAIVGFVLQADDMADAAEALVTAALAAGGHDNVTVVLATTRSDTVWPEDDATREMTVPRARLAEEGRR